MTSTKISAMTAAAALSGPELFAGVQSAANVKITGTQVKTFVCASPTLVTPVLGVATGTSLTLSGVFNGGTGTASAPTFASSADANTGIYFNGDHTIRLTVNGSQLLQIGSSGQFTSTTSSGFAILNGASTATAPTFIPNQLSATTGIGGTSGNISLIAGGAEQMRVGTNSIIMATLPTADPHVVGQLWRNSGVMTVSAG